MLKSTNYSVKRTEEKHQRRKLKREIQRVKAKEHASQMIIIKTHSAL